MNDMPALAYVVLRCSDLERSRRFYEALGLALRAEQHGAGATHYSMTLGDVVIELYPVQAEPSVGVRVGLRVADPQRDRSVSARGRWRGCSCRRGRCARPRSRRARDPSRTAVGTADGTRCGLVPLVSSW